MRLLVMKLFVITACSHTLALKPQHTVAHLFPPAKTPQGTSKSGKGSNCTIPIAYQDGILTSYFGWRDDPFGKDRKFHHGIDIGSSVGVKVRAVAGGRVYFAGRSKRGGGLQVNIRASNGLKFKYAHLSKITVYEGEQTQRGQVIGRVGNTGRSMGPHLHLEVYRNKGRNKDDFVDPTHYVCNYLERIWKR